MGRALAPIVVLLALVGGGRAAAAHGSAGVRCLERGSATVDYAATGPLSQRTATLDFGGVSFLCHSSDRWIRSATVAGKATLVLDCLRGFAAIDQGTYTITWSNGRTSVVPYVEHARFALGHSVGIVSAGEFAGMRLEERDLEAASPAICVSTRGRTTGFYFGAVRIG